MVTVLHATAYNKAHNWMLVETRLFDDRDAMIYAYLDVIDLSTMKPAAYVDDIDQYEWEQVTYEENDVLARSLY